MQPRMRRSTRHRSRSIAITSLLVLAFSALVSLGGATPAQADINDDYPPPWHAPSAPDAYVDDWGYLSRECTSFAAWRLHNNNGYEITHAIGQGAGDWGNSSLNGGFTPDSSPAPGAIAWWGYSQSMPSGHVAWVESVSADKTQVTIEEYNWNFNHNFNERTIAANTVGGYIHFKDVAGGGASGDYNHDGFSDLHKVVFSGTGSGNIEDHVLTGINFSSWLAHITTAWSAGSSRSADYLLGDYNHDNNPDLYMIARNPTTGHIEVHILAGPLYTQSLADYVTPDSASSLAQFEVALGDYNRDGYPDLYVAYFNGTGSGHIELHVLNGTNFQADLGAWVTPMGAASTNDQQFVLGDYNHDGNPDFYLVVLGGAGQHEVDVHVLLGPNYNQANWAGHWATPWAPAHSTDERILIGDYNHDGYGDLYLVTYATPESGGTTATEVHVLNGTSFTGADLGDWRSVSTGTSQSVTEFGLG